MKKLNLFAVVAIGCLVAGCGADENKRSISSVEPPSASSKSAPTEIILKSIPLGVQFNEDGSTYLSQQGLTVLNTPPKDEGAATAWEYYSLSDQHKYEEASQLLEGYGTSDQTSLYDKYVGKGRSYLEEVEQAKLLRWADITAVAPKEIEDEGAYAYKVIYLEMDFQTKGALTAQQTDMKNGVNIYAIHVRQDAPGSEWKISMFGGAPPMES